MTDRSKLLALAEAVEKLTGPDRQADVQISVVLQIVGSFEPNPRNVAADPSDDGWLLYDLEGVPYTDEAGNFTASIDVAATLVPEGFDWYITSIRPLTGKFAGAVYDGPHPTLQYAEAATPALALCAAALRAQAEALA